LIKYERLQKLQLVCAYIFNSKSQNKNNCMPWINLILGMHKIAKSRKCIILTLGLDGKPELLGYLP
jgi:hypothetical protein